MPEALSPLDSIDIRRLLEARLWVARLGESDVKGWWRTDGMLGSDGAYVGPRVLPITHPTARARIVFAVAAHACGERHPDTKAMHLFRLTPEIEDRLDALLVERLGEQDFWNGLMTRLEAITKESDPAETLKTGGLVSVEDLAYVNKQQLGPAERSVPISADSPAEIVGRLTAGFVRSKPGTLAVPYLSSKG